MSKWRITRTQTTILYTEADSKADAVLKLIDGGAMVPKPTDATTTVEEWSDEEWNKVFPPAPPTVADWCPPAPDVKEAALDQLYPPQAEPAGVSQ